MSAPEIETCGTCWYWKPVGDPGHAYEDREASDWGQCRARPPTATGGMMSNPETIWPHTRMSDFCGSYEPGDRETGRRLTIVHKSDGSRELV